MGREDERQWIIHAVVDVFERAENQTDMGISGNVFKEKIGRSHICISKGVDECLMPVTGMTIQIGDDWSEAEITFALLDIDTCTFGIECRGQCIKSEFIVMTYYGCDGPMEEDQWEVVEIDPHLREVLDKETSGDYWGEDL